MIFTSTYMHIYTYASGVHVPSDPLAARSLF
jgi:hypothetical protein